jgi:hypothetical protein
MVITATWLYKAIFIASHNICFAKRFGGVVNPASHSTACYTIRMTKLLDEAIERLRRLPAPLQDSAARTLIHQLEEEPDAGDRQAVAEGRRDFQRGDFVTLDQFRHEMGLGNR